MTELELLRLENNRLKKGLIAIKKMLAHKPSRKLKKEIHRIVNETLYPETIKTEENGIQRTIENKG